MNRRGGGYWGNGAEPRGEVMWMGECWKGRGSSPELCVKVRGSSSMLRLGCLGDLLGLEE